MASFRIQEADDLYQVTGWGAPYVSISSKGTLQVHPTGESKLKVDLKSVMDQLRDEGLRPPVVLRFPQILEHRVERLNRAFRKALKDNDVKSRYRGVFPIKVNQRREVVQELARAGRKYQYGLEVGSKAELLAALTMDPNRKSLLIVNGFKDRRFLEAAVQATAFKDEVVIVLDEVGELPHLLPMLDGMERKPIIGLRLKLRSKAPGKWSLSGGQKSKFGLTVPEVLWAVELLKEAGHLDCLKLLHFHIGSQISQIRRMAEGVRESARLFVELHKLGVPLSMMDVGGGMAVDYDGTGSSGSNSCNYTLEEYASTVVATLKDVCDEADVPVPDIISESGRAVVSHHAVMVIDGVRRVPYAILPADEAPPSEDDPISLHNLWDMYHSLNAKNVFESFHDALQYRDDLNTLFDLGHLGVEALGKAERITMGVWMLVKEILEDEGEVDCEEYQEVQALLRRKLVCNFSIFQSLPDVWGVQQQFPITPIHRLDEKPTETATIADITCDSDGEIRRFPGVDGTRADLPIHSLRDDEPYYLGVFMVGAYQDTLGDYHNLFGETNEAFVHLDRNGAELYKLSYGSQVKDMLEWVRYNPQDLRRRIRGRVERLRKSGRITAEEARDTANLFVNLLSDSTYLEVNN